MTLYAPPDMELWLTTWLRSRIPGVRVTNKQPADTDTPLSKPVIVIRDDGGPQHDLAVFDRNVGVSVLAASKSADQPANDLARQVYAHLTSHEILQPSDSPIAAIVESGCNGPYAVDDDHDYARRYMTVQYAVVGVIG